MKKIILLCSVLVLVNGCSLWYMDEYRDCHYNQKKGGYYKSVYDDNGKYISSEKCDEKLFK